MESKNHLHKLMILGNERQMLIPFPYIQNILTWPSLSTWMIAYTFFCLSSCAKIIKKVNK